MARHQNSSAQIAGRFLEEQGADNELIARVKQLVSRHELGGDAEENLLKDADRLSFFDRDLSLFIDKRLNSDGLENIKEKFEWNFENISSPEAKKIARPMYNKAMKLLKEVKQ